MAEHHAAQPRRVETPAVGAQPSGVGLQPLVRLDGKTRDGAREQHLRVERPGFGEIGQQRTVPIDAGAAAGKGVGHPAHARPHGGPGRNERMLVEDQDQDQEVAEPLVTRGRQLQVVRHTEREWIRTGHDIEKEREVTSTACHRSDDGEVRPERQRRRGRQGHARSATSPTVGLCA